MSAIIEDSHYSIVFGTRSDELSLPRIVNLPTGTQRVKIRMRQDCFTVAYVKTNDRVAAYYLRETEKGDWELMPYPIGANALT